MHFVLYPLPKNCTIQGMSPEDLHNLRRRLRLTQVQFADRLGISPALVASLECGRRRITERHVREIARISGGNVYEPPPILAQNAVAPVVQKTGSSQRSYRVADRPAERRERSLTLADLLRRFAEAAPVRVTKPASSLALPAVFASAPKLVPKSVQAEQPAAAAVSNPASGLRPAQAVAWSKCTWRDPEVGLCAGLTPQGMLYCAVHMALAMIEGRPTRHG
jgi:transcriptional regulator with XRE-family HTH domain